MGVPERPDTNQRDLLVDNLAGLRRQLEDGSWTLDRAAAGDLYKFDRKNVGLESLQYRGGFVQVRTDEG